jgi:hypothetical protein
VFHFITKTIFTSPGSVIVAPEYDSIEGAPLNEKVAFTYEDAKDGSPYVSFACPLKVSALHPNGAPKLVRAGSVPTGGVKNDYDAGQVWVCTQDGLGTTTLWGKVWVEYDCELFTPQSNPLGSSDGQSYKLVTAGGCTTAANFGTSANQTVTGQPQLSTPPQANILTSAIDGFLLVNLITTAVTTATETAIPVASTGSSLSSVWSYQVGSGSASMSQSYGWNAIKGATLTFNNTIVGGGSAFLLVSSILPPQ